MRIATVIAVLVALGAPAPATAGEVGPSGLPFASFGSDFDDDGFEDLAIGAPFELVGGEAEAGAIHVIYGSEDGLTATGSQVWHQDKGGVDDQAEEGDHFGWAMATGDIDADGFDDLAIGIPGEDLPGDEMAGVGPQSPPIPPAPDGGAVQILFGGPVGLDSDRSFFFRSLTAEDRSGSELGYSVAMLDVYDEEDFLGQDGLADVAIGAPGVDDGTGEISIFSKSCFEDGSGFDCSGVAVSFPQLDDGARAGTSLAAGDLFDNDIDELVVGAPFADRLGVVDAGRVLVMVEADVTAQVAQGNRFQEAPEEGDHLGESVATGDLDIDGLPDILVGVPDEDLGGRSNAGLVQGFIADGESITGDVLVDQDTTGFAGSRQEHARFGATIASGDLDLLRGEDVVIGAPGYDVSGITKAGAVIVAYGFKGGWPGTESELWDQDTDDVRDTAETKDQFGLALAIGAFGKSEADDVAIGVPKEDFSDLDNAGVVQVLYGDDGGLTGNGDQRWTQDETDIGESADAEDEFGTTVR